MKSRVIFLADVVDKTGAWIAPEMPAWAKVVFDGQGISCSGEEERRDKIGLLSASLGRLRCAVKALAKSFAEAPKAKTPAMALQCLFLGLAAKRLMAASLETLLEEMEEVK